MQSVVRSVARKQAFILVVLLLCACSPQLDWALALNVADSMGPVAGAEVAVDGGFVGVTDTQGKLVVNLQKPIGAQVQFTLRQQGIEVLRLPVIRTVQLPSLYQWLKVMDVRGRAQLPEVKFTFPRIEPQVEAEQQTAEEGLPSASKRSVVEANLPDEAPSSSAVDTASTLSTEPQSTFNVTQHPFKNGVENSSGVDVAALLNPLPASILSVSTSSSTANDSAPNGTILAGAENLAQNLAGNEKNSKGELAETRNGKVPSNGRNEPVIEHGGEPNASENGGGNAAGKDPATALAVSAARATATASASATSAEPSVSKNLSLSVEVMSEGKPLGGAQVYTAKRSARKMVKLGATSENGVLESDYPAALLGETIFVRHSCCFSQQLNLPKAIQAGSSDLPSWKQKLSIESRKLRVDLAPGVSHDFFVRQQSYGVPRVFERVSLVRNAQTLEVTNSLGVASVSGKNLAQGNTALEFYSADAVPLRRNEAFMIESKTEEEPFLVSMSQARVPSPVVGFYETLRGKIVYAESHLVGEPLFRRARREFLSRFIQEKTFRPLIFSELSKLVHQGGQQMEKIARDGWDIGPLQGEFDYLVVLEMGLVEGFGMKLLDSSGRAVWKENFTDAKWLVAPEIAGRKAFDTLLSNLPFETAIVSKVPLAEKEPNSDAQMFEIGDEKAIGLSFQSGTKLESVWSPETNSEGKNVNVRGCEGRVADISTHIVFSRCPVKLSPGTVLRRCNARCEYAGFLGENAGKVKN